MAEGTQLHKAVAHFNVGEVSSLLEQGVEVDARDGYGQTALHLAIKRKFVSAVHLLLGKGFSVNVQDAGGYTPLHFAILGSNKILVQRLLKTGAETELRNECGQTALHLAAVNVHTVIFESLLEAGADHTAKDAKGRSPMEIIICRTYGINQENMDIKALVNVRNDKGRTPLHIAVKKSAMNLVRVLIESGADADSTDNDGQTPLHLAIKGGLEPVVMLLLEAGAGVNRKNKQSEPPLHCALAKRNVRVMAELLDRGADIDCKDDEDLTAIDIAFKNCFLPGVELLISSGAKVSNNDAFYYVIENQNYRLLKILLETGADIEAQSKHEIPFLTLLNSFPSAVHLALERGVNVNIKNIEGKTPLHYFQPFNDNERVFTMLLDKGADIESKDNLGRTPLFETVKNSWRSGVELLLNRGADVNARDNEGKTPLHYVDDNVIVELLLNNGADLEAKDNYGRSPSHSTDIEAFDKLIEKGGNLESEDINGITPILFFSVYYGLVLSNNDIKKTLCSTDNEGKTPLHVAISKEFPALVDYLLEKGSDVNIKDKYGSTPLHEAVIIEDEDVAEEIIEKLVKRGAALNVQNQKGKTPLHLAVSYCRRQTIEVLLVNGASMDIENNRGQTPLQLEVPPSWSTWSLMKHIVKVNTANLQDIFPISTKPFEYEDSESFKSLCTEELERMKTVKFGCNTLSEVFSEYNNPLFVSNSEMEQNIKSPSLKLQFPVYASLLCATFNKAKHKHFLLVKDN